MMLDVEVKVRSLSGSGLHAPDTVSEEFNRSSDDLLYWCWDADLFSKEAFCHNCMFPISVNASVVLLGLPSDAPPFVGKPCPFMSDVTITVLLHTCQSHTGI